MSGWGLRAVVLAAVVFALGAGYASRIPAADDFATVEAGDSVLIDVLANDGALGPDLTLLRVNGRGPLGQAVVEDQQVRFSADPGVTGSQQLSYTVRRANGQVAGGRIFVTVEPDTLQITLRGTLPDTLSTCTLAVVVGEARFEGCSTDGAFEIDISSPDTDAIVVVEASARPFDVADEYRYASVLGTLPQLVNLAEAAFTPGVLDSSQFGHLRLHEYTTMHHALLLAEGGPGVFASGAALAQVEKDLDAQRLHALAVAFHAARRGLVALPVGIDDPYAFAFDLPAYDAFQAGDLAPVYVQAQQALVNLPHVPIGWPDGVRIGPLLGGMGAVPGTINVPVVEGRSVVLETTGDARVYLQQNAPDSAALWEADAFGAIHLDQEAPAVLESTIFVFCETDAQEFLKQEEITLERLTRVIHSGHSDVVLFHAVTRFLNYADIPPGCTTTQSEVAEGVWPLQTFDRDTVLPIGPVATPGRWATRLPQPTSDTLAGANYEGNAGFVDFVNDTVDAPGLGPAAFMANNGDNGWLVGLSAGGPGGAPIELQIYRTRTDGRGGEQWLIQADSDGLGALGLGGLTARETHPDLFADATEAVGAWRSAFGIVTAGRQVGPQSELVFDILPGSPGRGVRYSGSSQQPFAWEVDGAGRLVITTLRSTVTGQLLAECQDECYIWQRRTWQPVSLDVDASGKRLYMIEEIELGNPEDDQLDLISRRVNFYDETGSPDPVTPEGPAPTRARMR